MGINRRIRRNNNIAGLKAQLADKEKEIYMLSQQQDMQRAYFDEVTKISTALKDILTRELKLNEDDLMKMLEAELDVTEAAEIDEVIKSEKVDVPSIEIVDENEIPETEVSIKYQELAADGNKSDVEIRKELKLDDKKVKEKKAPAKVKKPVKAVPPKKELEMKERKKKESKE